MRKRSAPSTTQSTRRTADIGFQLNWDLEAPTNHQGELKHVAQQAEARARIPSELGNDKQSPPVSSGGAVAMEVCGDWATKAGFNGRFIGYSSLRKLIG